MIVITTASITGHLAMSQIVVAVLEIPIGFATASTIGPVNMSASSKIAARTTMTSVTSNCTGRSFQIGLPSGVS